MRQLWLDSRHRNRWLRVGEDGQFVKFENVVVIGKLVACANDRDHRNRHRLALPGRLAQGFSGNHGLARGSQGMGRTRVISTRQSADFAVADVAEATAVAEDVESSRISVLGRL